MKISTVLATTVLLTAGAFSAASLAEDKDSTHSHQLSSAEFVKKAGAAGLAEVEMGKLGSEKATNADVKAFAQQMVTDHGKANKQLAEVARNKGLEVPTSPDLTHKGAKEKLKLQGADRDFDHDFMQQMVRDHEAAVELFQTASTDSGVAPELRSLAKKTLPTLQHHLEEAQKLEAKLGS